MTGLFVVFALAGLFTLRTPGESLAATNNALNFQARLESSSGAIVPDDTYNIQFKLYNVSSGGTALWTETYQRSNSQGIDVRNGYVTVNLGSITSFPAGINWDQDLYLTMNVGGTSTGATPTYDGEMTPRLKLTAVPYAFRAGQLAKLTGGNTSTLDFASQTGARSILLPDESGTICIQNSSNCGFLTGAAADGNYVKLQGGSPPGTPQTGNFNIDGTGIAGILQGSSKVLTPLLDTAAAGPLDVGTTNANAITIGSSGILTTLPGTVRVGATTSQPAQVTILSGASSQRGLVIQGAAGQTADILDIYNGSGSFVSGFDASGNIYANGTLNLGTGSSAGQLRLKDGTGLQVTLKAASQSGSYTYSLPASTGNDTICLLTLNNCSTGGGGSYVTLQTGSPPGTPDTGNFNINGTGIAGILQAATINATTKYQINGTDGVTTTCSGGDLLENAVIQGGIVTGGTCVAGGGGGITSLTLAGTSGTGQSIADGDTITIAAGTNITTTAAATDTVTVATVNNPSFSGVITSTVATGTAPFAVASTTKVTNLNADLLDGLDSTAFQAAGSYLTAEADTLATVTGRGATTSVAATFTGGATIRGLTVNTATATDDQIILQATAAGPARFNGTLTNADLTVARTWTLPDVSGTFITTGNLTSITSVGTITAGVWQGTAIGAQYGGTGQSSYAIGDLLYASGATTLSRLADVAAGSCLLSGGVGVAPTWGSCGGGGGGITSLTLAGTSGTGQSIADGDTITIAAGTNITTTAAATDTVTVATVNNPSFSGVITSTVATGTAPFAVASTTKVTNLNADTLDGIDSTGFAAATGSANYIQNQNASAQATSNFWISGTGTVNLLNSVTGYQFNGTAGSTTTCTGGQFLQNAVIQGGIVTGGTCVAGGGGGGTYVTLQTLTPGAADMGNFNINGTGIAAILQAGTFDTASATTLNIGSTNATAISIGKTTSNTLTTINGTALVKPTTGNDSTTAFRVQDAGGTNVLNIDTTTKGVTVGSIGTPVSQLYVGGLIPTAATSSTSFASGRTGHALAAAGNYIYTANFVSGNNAIEVYDVTKPSTPALVNGPSGMSLTFGVTDLAVSGHYLYAVGGSGANGFHVIDISNPSNLVDLMQINVDPIYTLSAISVQGRYAYILASSGSLYIYDISNPATPTLAGSITSLGITTARSFSLAVEGGYAYISAYSPGKFYIVNISNPASPTLMNAGGYALASNANQVVVQGRYAYVANQNVQKLQIIDISNPSTPTAVSTLSGTISGASISVAVAGQRAYVLDDTNKLYVIDIANPASPQVLGNVSTATAASKVIVAGRYAYVSASTLQLFDLGGSNIQQLQAGSASLGSLQLSGSATIYGSTSIQGGLQVGQSLAVSGNFGANGSVYLRNASNSAAAFLVQRADGSALFTADTSGAQIVVGTTTNGIILSSTGLQLKGTARSTKTIKLIPEFAGAVFSADGSNNVGYMTSDHVTGHNYYAWATDQTPTPQDYDINVMYQLPSDFDGFAAGTFKFWAYVDDVTNGNAQVMITDAAGTNCYASMQSIKPGSATTWAQTTISDPANGCSFAANDLITITIKPTALAPQTNYVKVGEFQFDYKAKF